MTPRKKGKGGATSLERLTGGDSGRRGRPPRRSGRRGRRLGHRGGPDDDSEATDRSDSSFHSPVKRRRIEPDLVPASQSKGRRGRGAPARRPMEEIIVVRETYDALRHSSVTPRRPGGSPRDLVPDREGLLAEYGRLYALKLDLFRRRTRLEEEARALRESMAIAGGRGGAAAAASPRRSPRLAAGTSPTGLLEGGERTALLGRLNVKLRGATCA